MEREPLTTELMRGAAGDVYSAGLPGWLRDAVIDGLRALFGANLAHHPATDTALQVLGAWLLAIARWPVDWDEALDGERVRRAFADLCNRQSWPVPIMLANAMEERMRPEPPDPPTEVEIRERMKAGRPQRLLPAPAPPEPTTEQRAQRREATKAQAKRIRDQLVAQQRKAVG